MSQSPGLADADVGLGAERPERSEPWASTFALPPAAAATALFPPCLALHGRTMRFMLSARFSALAVCSLIAAGCDQKSPSAHGTPAATIASAAPAASSAPIAPGPAASVPASAAAEPALPALSAMFDGEPSAGTRRSETVTGAGGVYAGLPPDWSTQDVYNDYLIASTPQSKAMVYLDTGTSLDSRRLDDFAKGAAYPIYLKGLEWDSEWTDAKAGVSGYPCKVRRGHGVSISSATTRRAAIAVGVEIPGRKTIYILGAWDDPSAAAEQQFRDIIRGIGRCKHKPNRGCVPVLPAGAEDELPDPPKAGPGSSPFG